MTERQLWALVFGFLALTAVYYGVSFAAQQDSREAALDELRLELVRSRGE